MMTSLTDNITIKKSIVLSLKIFMIIKILLLNTSKLSKRINIPTFIALVSVQTFTLRVLSLSLYVELYLKLPLYQLKVHQCNYVIFLFIPNFYLFCKHCQWLYQSV